MLTIDTVTLGAIQTNAYVIADTEKRRCIVIDPGMNPEPLLRRVADYEVEAILLTHAHFDHIGGVDELRKLKGCPVYLHDLEAGWLADPKKNLSADWPGLKAPVLIEPADYALEDRQILRLLGQEIRVYHTPGHSPGSVSFLMGDKLFGGDVLFKLSVGNTELPGGDWRELYDSIHSVLFKLDGNTTVYPGHGPRTTIQFEKEHNPYV